MNNEEMEIVEVHLSQYISYREAPRADPSLGPLSRWTPSYSHHCTHHHQDWQRNIKVWNLIFYIQGGESDRNFDHISQVLN